ncbi:MAG: hypothetical protein ACI4KA_10880 [Oscillospiraceae bacterium]
MRVFNAELLRVIKNKSFCLIFVILTAATLLFAAFAPIDELIENKLYIELLDQTEGYDSRQAEEYISEKYFEYSVYHALSWGFDMPELFEDERAAKYITEYESLDENSVEIFHKYMLYKQEFENIASINDYERLALSFGEQADALSGFSLFADENSFEYRSIIKSAEAYKNAMNIQPEYSASRGINTAVSNVVGNISVLVIAVIAAILLFADRNSNQFALSMKNGGRYYASVKLCVLVLITVLSAVFISLANVGAACVIYGLGDISRPVQGVEGFVFSPFVISVGEMLFLSVMLKALSAAAFGFIASLLCVCIRSNAAVFIITTMIIVIEAVLFFTIPSQSNMAIAKYANLWALSDTQAITGEYLNLNMFGYPFSNSFICIVFSILVSLLLVCSVLFFYPNTISSSNNLLGSRKSIFSTSLLLHEIYRIFIERKGAFAFILAICISSYYGNSFKMNYDVDERYKTAYINDIGGEINGDTYNYINAEKQRFADVQEQINELQTKYTDGKISAQGYSAAYSALLQETAGSRAFSYLEQQVVSADGKGELIYDTGYNKLTAFDGFTSDVIPSMIAVLLIIVLIAPMYSKDKEIGLQKIISSTIRGKQSLAICRVLITATISLTACLIAFFPQYYTVFTEYGGEWLYAPVQSLMQLSDFPLKISILDYLFLINAIRIISCVIIGESTLAVSKFSDKSFVSIALTTLVFVSPLFLYILGAEFLSKIGLTPFLIGNALWI